MKSIYGELKEQAFRANMEIPRRGLAIYTFGNVSAFDARARRLRDQAERCRLRRAHRR